MSNDMRAVIDVGSNTVRLCVYRITRGGSLKKVFDERKPVGLAQYVSDGVMSDEGIKAAAKAINGQLDCVRLLNCPNVIVFATAALRNCSNSKRAVRALEGQINAAVDLLSAKSEAELGYLGAREYLSFNDGMCIDIGGGSTEVSVVCEGTVRRSVSVPQGSLSSWKAHVGGVLPTQDELNALRLSFGEALDTSGIDIAGESVACGIGGSIRNAAKLYGRLFCDGERPTLVKKSHIDELLRLAEEEPYTFSRAMLAQRPDRLHTIVPGMAILDEVLARSGTDEVKISKYGIREGYILSRL